VPTPAQDAAVERFADAVSRDPVDLGEAALCLALTEEPGLDLPRWRAELDQLGEALAARLAPVAPSDQSARLAVLCGYLFGELGLLGNEADYYDPANSYLHRVLERGVGIPISLSVLTIEVARRAGLSLHGVGFPGHFLVGAGGGVFLDAFHQGRLLDAEQCEQLLHAMTGGRLAFDPGYLAPVEPRSILVRMLNNLKGAHLRRGQQELARLDVERLRRLGPIDR
jgi:regulator of sirC expression with transglutaminase-like and TPR domain